MNAPKGPSRRALFRGSFGQRPGEAEGWQRVPGLDTGAGDVFWCGWADEAGVIVAGDDGAIWSFDGGGWARMDSPAPVPVHAIWGTGRAALWAVGWMGLILHHDGAAWHQVHGCVVGENGRYSQDPANTPLFDVTGAPDGQAWAVGDHGTILHFDGSAWRAETSGTRVHLRSICRLEDGTILAAGGDGTVLIRDGEGGWRKLDCPVASNFTAALPLGGDAVLFAGGRFFAGAGGFRGDLVLWRAGAFERLFPETGFSRFRALAAGAAGILAVGDGGSIHRITDGEIHRLDSGIQHDLLGVVTLLSGEALAVGDFGTVLAAGAETLDVFAAPAVASDAPPVWEAEDSGTDRQLWGLWHDEAEGRLYACGEEGTVLVRDRGRWERLPTPGDLGLHALARDGDGGLLAAGQLGEVHRFDGSGWHKEYDLLMDVTILSLWSDGRGRVMAAGDEGLILDRGPEGWKRAASGTKSALYGLWGPDADHLLAVGDFGLVLRWNGTRWDSFNAGTEHFLFDVRGRALDDICAVGLSGTICHYDGQRWTVTPARARKDLLALTGDATRYVAVGAGGVAAIHDGQGWALDSTGTDAGLRAVAMTGDGGCYAAGDGGLILKRRGGEER